MSRLKTVIMKHWLISLLFLSSATLALGQRPSPIHISGMVADSLNVEGRTAYHFISFENQAAFIDSCRIRGGHFVLEGQIPFDEVTAEVLIDRVPLSSGSIVVRSGDRIEFDFAPLGRMGRPDVSGSASQEELCRLLKAPVVALRKRLQAEFMQLPAGDNRRAALGERIDSCFRAEAVLWRELLRTTRSGFNAVYACLNLLPDMTEREQTETYAYIRTEFPDDVNFSTLTGTTPSGMPVAAMTPESREAFNRYARIVGDPLPYPETREERGESELTITPPDSAAPDAESSAASASVYGPGDLVADFSLPDRNGNAVAWSSLTTPYVLLDFWASWCAPCRRELPGLLDAASRFDGALSVCAVSVDEDAAAWRSAMEQEGLSPLLNLRLDRSDASFAELVARFDIRTIPHNLLLDGERRVVAVDLRGDALREWLEQHVGR